MTSPRHLVRLPDGQTFGPADVPLPIRWANERRIPQDAAILEVDNEGRPMGEPIPATGFDAIRFIITAPPTTPATPAQALPAEEGFIQRAIPTRNTYALVGYYLAVIGLLPVMGVPFSIAAVICGIIGYVRWRQDHDARGKTHAIVAIVGGILVPIAWGLIWVLLVVMNDS